MGIWFLSSCIGKFIWGNWFAGEASGDLEEALAQMPDSYMADCVYRDGLCNFAFFPTEPVH